MACIDSRRPAAASAARLLPTLGFAAVCWPLSARLMGGMDIGVATRPGPFGFFVAVWTIMMAAMMLPGAAPAVARYSRANGGLSAASLFVGAYLGVWAVAGAAAFALDRPHGTPAAGAVVMAAGVYEATPTKRRLRLRCREGACSGLEYGLCCAGSTAGLMAVLVALDVMSLLWMAVVTALTCAQKLLPAKAAVDTAVALALVGLGVATVVEPSLVPGLAPSMAVM